MEESGEIVKDDKKKEMNREGIERLRPSIEEPPELELKELPEHLEYTLLKENSNLPVIISSKLNDEQKEKLLKVLREHKRAIAWKVADIKGISPHFAHT